MSALTIAHAHPDSIAEGRLLTKLWRSATDKPEAARFPFLYRFERVEFEGHAGLSAILRRIEADISACIIRGELKAGLDPSGWYQRRYKGPDAPLTDVPRDWLMVDLDRGVCTTDEMQRSLMPELTARAAVLRHSGSSGHPTLNGVYRVHLWFILDRPLSSVEAKAWIESWNRQSGTQMLDPSIYAPGSVHFTARPLVQPTVVDATGIMSAQAAIRDPFIDANGVSHRVADFTPPGAVSLVTPPPREALAEMMAECIPDSAEAIEDAEAVEVVKSAHPNHRQEAVDFFYQHLDRRCTAEGCAKWLQKNPGKNGGDFAHWVLLPGGPLARADLIDVSACIDRAVAASVANGGKEPHARNSAKNALRSTGITASNIVVSRLREAAARREAVAHVAGFPTASEANTIPPPAFGKSEEEEWPALLSLDIAATAVPQPREDWVPEAYRQWLADIAHRKGCPYDFVLATFVVMGGSLIGPRLGIRPTNDDDDWLEVPNIWGLVVSRSGTLKSPAISDVLAPVRECAKEFMAKFGEEMRRYEAEEEVHKTAVGGLKRSVSGQFANGAPIINPTAAPEGNAAVADAVARTKALTQALMSEPTKPMLRRLIVGMFGSSVRLLRLLSEEASALMFHDEIVAALYTWSTANDPEQRAVMLTAWDGKAPVHYESETQGILHADRACLSLFGGGQPKALLQFMAKARAVGDGHDGFLQRFGALVFPSPKKWARPSRKLDTAARGRAHAAIKALVHLDFNGIGARPGASHGGIPWVPLSAGARKLFDAWLDKQAEREFEGDETEAHLSKHRKLVPALALILTVADFVARSAPSFPWLVPNGIGEIGEHPMRVAIEMADYFAAHARKLYSAGSARMGAAEKLAEAILAGKPVDGSTVSALVRAGWRGLTDDDEVTQAVDVLADLGWLRLQPVKRASGGPRTFRIELRPNIAREGRIIQPEAAGVASTQKPCQPDA